MVKETFSRVFARRNTFVDDDLNDFTSDSSSMWRKIVRSYIRPFRSVSNAFHSLISFFPIIFWIRTYSIKNQLLGDAIGGIMGGILNITQGIAYSLLAGLPPQTGLYTTFVGGMIYPLVASWPHGAIAPFAIIELMCGTAADSVMDELFVKNYSRQFTFEQLLQINPSTIVSTLTFMVGIICFIFALLRIQFLAQYFSEPLVSGFVTAASIHVLFSQVDTIFGFQKPKAGGFFYMFNEIAEIYMLLPKTNLMCLSIAVLSFIFLCVTKCYLHDKICKLSGRKLMIPYELILVASTTALVYFMDLEKNFDVRTVGIIPTGIPAPTMPKTFLIKPLFWDAVAIAVVYVSLHLSIAKMLSIRQKYKIDENQELYAVGTVLACSSVLPVFPGSSGLGRPILLADAGATTPLANFISGLVVLCVILLAGPLFYSLPLCVLAVIVLFVLRSFFGGFWELPRLGIGVAFELFTVVARSQWPRWRVTFLKKTETADVCAFQFEAMLLFTNAERFKKVVRRVLKKWNQKFANSEDQQIQRTFIFDCSGITDVDAVGMVSFGEVVKELRHNGCVVYFSGCPESLIPKLQEVNAWQSEKEVFPTLSDATLQARLNQYEMGNMGSFSRENPRRSISVQYSV
ncbi:hypothetical protein M3Y96_01169200 [Aphelenchoides besseyi]|nr:hypothetical protein M3Y96_01169200 [Aphelenchoides besseyi]